MCGIAGFINYDFNDPYFATINEMQKHRGPDHQSSWQQEQVALYHQRLSIIDLSEEANQPFVKDSYVIVFNGEIYNYQELRKQLTSKGVAFRSSSDTEVLLELYREYKEKCLDFIRGMFAFAIYDFAHQELFLARDPFGIKPLFYTKSGLKVAFASEMKTLVAAPGFNKSLNMQSMVDNLDLLWVPGSDSMFAGCHKLPAAHYATIDLKGNIAIKRYWSFSKMDVRPENVEEMLHSYFNDSIQKHMVSDVPVSAFLSGGLDSSLIAVLANRTAPLSTYTIKTSTKDQRVEQMPDDARYARIIAEKYGLDHHEIEIDPSISEELPKMVYHLDEPIGDPAALNTYLICKAAKERGSKVLLSGMGADELFFGYRRQRATLLAMKYQRVPAGVRQLVSGAVNQLPVKIGNRGIKLTRWAKRFATFANLPPSEAYLRSYSYYDKSQLSDMFVQDVQENVHDLYESHLDTFNHFEGDFINKICYTDTQWFMQGLNLTYTDRASMAASVEVRVPFIDKELANLAMNISGDLKFKNGESKAILKKVAERYLPKEIIYRPKASFGAPIRSWISGDLVEMVDDLLNESAVKKRGVFNPIFVNKLINEDRRGTKDHAYQIYQLLNLELWFQQFVDS